MSGMAIASLLKQVILRLRRAGVFTDRETESLLRDLNLGDA